MIRQDYLMAMIEQFFKAIARLVKLRNSEPEKVMPILEDLYTDYLKHDRDFFLTSDLTAILQTFAGSEKEIAQTEMLAELFYRELQIFGPAANQHLPGQLLQLYDYIDKQTREYSIERMNRRKEIELLIGGM
ncbi:MAG: hypothetical protein RR346_09720 [Bacteroidales bacterium]